LVTAHTAGSAIITVTTTDGGKTATCNVSVTSAPVAVTGVTVSPTTMTLTAGGATGTVTATVLPTNAANQTVTWSSDHPEFASVNSTTGVVTPVAAGVAVIIATTADGSFTPATPCTVTVNPAPTGTNYTATYTFASVTASSGTTDPTPPPTVTGVTFGSFKAVGVGANPNAGGRFSFTGNWPAGNLDPTKYYEVTITPDAGVSLDISSIVFNEQSSAAGAKQWAVRSSVDGYAANLPASISPANSNLTANPDNSFEYTVTPPNSSQSGSKITLLGSGFIGITTPITFRFYGFNSGTGTFSLNNPLTFSGKTY
jgi:hypothetical protein